MTVDPFTLPGIAPGLPELQEAWRRGLADNWLEHEYFPEQVAFIRDPARRKAALCSRRAGKTHALAAYLVWSALKNPGTLQMYMAITRQQAKDLLWKELIKVNEGGPKNLHPFGARTNEAELTMTFPNGSRIWLRGADKSREIEKYLGFAYKLVAIDECASFGSHIDVLIEHVLEPALEEHKGTLCLTGTPNAACVGFFFEATEGHRKEEYTTHRWTVLDNPKFPRWAKDPRWQETANTWISNYRRERGWSENNPTFLREWKGIWIRTTDDLVFDFDEERNTFHELPKYVEGNWHYALGIDLGSRSASAFIDVLWHDHDPNVYVMRGFKETGMDLTQIASEIRQRTERRAYSRLVIDTGGLGVMIAQDLQTRYGFPLEAAKKEERAAGIAGVNADMHEGRVKIHVSDPLVEEIRVLQWDEQKKNFDDRYEDHLCDAFLYAYRAAFHYRATKAKARPSYGTDAYWKAKEKKWWAPPPAGPQRWTKERRPALDAPKARRE